MNETLARRENSRTPAPSDPGCAIGRCALEMWRGTGKQILLRVQGTSMHPLITSSDSVSVRLTGVDQLAGGDILAFWEGENVVTHRIVRKRMIYGKWWFCEKGDNVTGWRWIPEEVVLGKVLSIHKPHTTLDLARKPWVLFNRAWSRAVSVWVAFQEKALPHRTSFASSGLHEFIRNAGNLLLRLCLQLVARLAFRRSTV